MTGKFKELRASQRDAAFKLGIESHGGIYGSHVPIPEAFLESVTSKLRSQGGAGSCAGQWKGEEGEGHFRWEVALKGIEARESA